MTAHGPLTVRDHLAAALHADRDHTRDGCKLGNEPICNCYSLADKAIAALGGVKRERDFGTVLGTDGDQLILLDYRGPYQDPRSRDYEREQIGWATSWVQAEPTPHTGGASS